MTNLEIWALYLSLLFPFDGEFFAINLWLFCSF